MVDLSQEQVLGPERIQVGDDVRNNGLLHGSFQPEGYVI